MLVAVADELQSGVPVVGAPGLGEELGLGSGFLLFGVLLSLPMAVGLLLEPLALAYSDRADRRRVLVAALLAMALLPALGAMAGSGLALALAIGLWGTATGIASGVAQGVLVSGPLGPERGMARWIRGAVLGDLAAPLLVAGVAALGGGWRGAMAAAGLVPLASAALVARAEIPPLVEEDEPDEPLGGALRGALADRELLGWLVAVASCTLLDEILLTLVALRVAGQGAEGAAQPLALLVGAVLGGLGTEALCARMAAPRLLLLASALSALALGLSVVAPTGWLAQASLALLGASAALHFPLAQASAYARLPGRPGLINALHAPLSALDLAVPLVVGALVSRGGVEAGLLALLAQPALVGFMAWRAGRAGR